MSRKIVRVFEVMPQASSSSLSLLQQISEADAPPVDGDEHGAKAEGDSSIQQVLGRIFAVPSDSVRVVLFLNDADLKSRYLTQNGPQQLADMIDVKKFQRDRIDGIMKTAISPFALNAVTDKFSNEGYAVLLNVKKQVWDQYIQAPNAEAKKKILPAIIDHKFYVAVLNVNNILKSKVGLLDDPHEREQKFDIKKFITAYPLRSVIDAARAEWDAKVAGAPAEGQASDEQLIANTEKKVIALLMSSQKNGQLKMPRPKFEAAFNALTTGAPEFKDKEHLLADVMHALANNPKIKRYRSILGDLVPAPDDAPPTEPAKDKNGKKIDIGDVDSADVSDIASKLASNPRVAKAVMKELQKYAI